MINPGRKGILLEKRMLHVLIACYARAVKTLRAMLTPHRCPFCASLRAFMGAMAIWKPWRPVL